MANSKTNKSGEPAKKEFFLVRWFKKPVSFLKSVFNELKKVVWPSRKELFNHTWVALVIIALFIVVVFGFDAVFSYLTTLLYGLG